MSDNIRFPPNKPAIPRLPLWPPPPKHYDLFDETQDANSRRKKRFLAVANDPKQWEDLVKMGEELRAAAERKMKMGITQIVGKIEVQATTNREDGKWACARCEEILQQDPDAKVARTICSSQSDLKRHIECLHNSWRELRYHMEHPWSTPKWNAFKCPTFKCQFKAKSVAAVRAHCLNGYKKPCNDYDAYRIMADEDKAMDKFWQIARSTTEDCIIREEGSHDEQVRQIYAKQLVTEVYEDDVFGNVMSPVLAEDVMDLIVECAEAYASGKTNISLSGLHKAAIVEYALKHIKDHEIENSNLATRASGCSRCPESVKDLWKFLQHLQDEESTDALPATATIR